LMQLELARVVHLNGQVKVPPQHVFSMSAPLGGYVASTTLVPGTRVKKGQLVVIMEDMQYIELQQQFLSAKARMNMLEAEYIRQRALNQSKATSDRELQQAQSEWESASVELRALHEKLMLIHIDADKLTAASISKTIALHAPFDGFVSKVNVNAGKYVTSSEVMVEFIQSENCYLGLTVFEKDMRELSPGMKLSAYGNNLNDTILCEIDFVNPDLTDKNTGEAICRFTGAHGDLIPGMFMQADAQLGLQRTTAMPAESVVHYQNKNYVFAQNDAFTFEMIEVNTGTEEDGFIAVTLLSPLNGRRVVYNGAYLLLMTLMNEAE
jgi:membrane fusion protein, heavy metal efflux system